MKWIVQGFDRDSPTALMIINDAGDKNHKKTLDQLKASYDRFRRLKTNRVATKTTVSRPKEQLLQEQAKLLIQRQVIDNRLFEIDIELAKTD